MPCQAPFAAPRPGLIAVTRRQFVKSIAQGSVAGGACLLSGCFGQSESPLRVGAIVWPGYECLFLSRKLGLLEGHPIKLVEYSSTPEALRAFRNGALEVVAVTGDEFLRLAAEDPTARAFLVADISKGADALVAGPSVKSPLDLRGRRVGVEFNSASVFMLARSLAAWGLKPEDVEIVSLEIEQQVEAFRSGQVEAVSCFEPTRTRLLRLGAQVIFDSSKIPGEIVDLLVAREPVLRQRATRLRTLVRAWFQARERLLAQPEQSAALLAEREGLSPEELLAALELLELPSLERNRQLLAARGPMAESLAGVHQFMRQTGQFTVAAPSAALFTQEMLP